MFTKKEENETYKYRINIVITTTKTQNFNTVNNKEGKYIILYIESFTINYIQLKSLE